MSILKDKIGKRSIPHSSRVSDTMSRLRPELNDMNPEQPWSVDSYKRIVDTVTGVAASSRYLLGLEPLHSVPCLATHV